MQHSWLLETELFRGDSDALVEALERRGIRHKVCKFGKSYEETIAEFHPSDSVVVHGSFQLASAVRRFSKLRPGVICDAPKYECSYYYARLGKWLLNEDYLMLPFGDIHRRKDWLYENFGSKDEDRVRAEDCIFLRPSSGTKTFTGMLLNRSRFDEDLKNLRYRGIEFEELMVVARPQKILREWRTVVFKNEIIAASQHREMGVDVRIAGARDVVYEFGKAVIEQSQYKPDPIWILDICETEDHSLRVTEVGCFSCSGLYACDPEPIIDAVCELRQGVN